jgi:hypothetical protein
MSSLLPIIVDSFGTGSCAAGVAAIGGTHLDYGPDSVSMRQGAQGTLFEGAITVEINGKSLTADASATFPDLTWTVTAKQVPYKGIFVWVQAADGNSFTHTGVGTGLQNVALYDALTENVIGNSPALKMGEFGNVEL